MMMSDNSEKINAGEIWLRSNGSYASTKLEPILVMAYTKGCVNYIPIRDYVIDKDYFFDDNCVVFWVNGTKSFVDIRQLRTCGANPLETYKGLINDEAFSKIRNLLSERLGITSERIVEVEKELSHEEKEKIVLEFLNEIAGMDYAGTLEECAKAIIFETKHTSWDTEDLSKEYLLESGWMEDHDLEVIQAEKLKVRSDSPDVWKAKAEAWESAFRLMCGKDS